MLPPFTISNLKNIFFVPSMSLRRKGYIGNSLCTFNDSDPFRQTKLLKAVSLWGAEKNQGLPFENLVL